LLFGRAAPAAGWKSFPFLFFLFLFFPFSKMFFGDRRRNQKKIMATHNLKSLASKTALSFHACL
jgi:hypothetical protein